MRRGRHVKRKEGSLKRAGILYGVIAASVLVPVSQAGAVQPIVQTFHTSLTNFVLEDCGDFQVILNLSHDETITTFLDESGAAVRSQIRFNFSATLTNSVTGKVALERGAFAIFVDLSSGEGRQAGLILQITVPGQGMVVLEIAQVSFDLAGNASLSGAPSVTQDESLLCSLLRGTSVSNAKTGAPSR